jgi:acylglycerol lipase
MGVEDQVTGTLKGKGGFDLFYRHIPADNERARVVIAHGLGEHSGRYGNVINRIVPKGCSVWAIDHQGHGNSGGGRGHVDAWDNYVSDLGLLVDLAHKDLPEGRKVILLGHSMGGLIALHYALSRPKTIDYLIVSSPLVGMIVEVPKVKGTLGKVMSSIWPTLSLSNELDPKMISKDREAVQAYSSDPLVHGKVSARWFTELLSAIDRVQELAPKLAVPTLMMVAGDDHLVNPKSSQEMFGKLTVEDKTLHVYDGYYHEIFNAPLDDREKVLADLETWLEAKLG